MGTAITTYVKVPYQLKSALHQLQGHHPNLLKLRFLSPESLLPRTLSIDSGNVKTSTTQLIAQCYVKCKTSIYIYFCSNNGLNIVFTQPAHAADG